MTTAINVQPEVERLKALQYTRELLPNEDGTWFARIVEFAGCMTEGDTPAEAIEMLDDAMTQWLTAKLEDGDPIPEPMAPERFPGKFIVRASRSLHRDLARRAEREGVSLNQYVVSVLASATGTAPLPRRELGRLHETGVAMDDDRFLPGGTVRFKADGRCVTIISSRAGGYWGWFVDDEPSEQRFFRCDELVPDEGREVVQDGSPLVPGRAL